VAKKIYLIKKSMAGNIHALIRSRFPREERHPSADIPSLDHYLVLSSSPPTDTQVDREYEVRLPKDSDNYVSLECVFAFDKKIRPVKPGSDKNAYARSRYMDEDQAIISFEEKAGLKSVDHNIGFAGKSRTDPTAGGKSFVILNRFVVAGTFKIEDRNKFATALLEGVGGRASFGNGLILVKRYRE
jgi:hypothetical protein